MTVFKKSVQLVFYVKNGLEMGKARNREKIFSN